MNTKIHSDYCNNHFLFHSKIGRGDDFNLTHPYIREDFQLDLFLKLLPTIKSTTPVMMELGVSDWPTYSMVFNDVFDNNCLNICTEVRMPLLLKAKERFPNGNFIHTYSGKPRHSQEALPPEDELVDVQQRTISSIMLEYNIDFIDMMHIDIQGSEVSLLEELKKDNLLNKVGIMFLSLHPEAGDMHGECLKILNTIPTIKYQYSHPSNGGYGDGLIVAIIN